jgi:hypothetical protein
LRYLLTPVDEADLAAHLCGDLGMRLLLSDVTTDGAPSIAAEPAIALPAALPGRPYFGDPAIRRFTFWAEALGPIATMRDAPNPTNAHERVSRILTRENAGDAFADVIDSSRTPLIQWCRCAVHSSRRVLPGRLGATMGPTQQRPRELQKLLRGVEVWLQQRAQTVDPFETCPEARERQPRNTSRFRVSVLPDAARWRREGDLEIWPWDG